MKTKSPLENDPPARKRPRREAVPVPEGMYEDTPRGPIGNMIMVFLGCVVIFLVGMWLYVFTGLARKDHPDLLASDEFSLAAESSCAPFRAAFDEIPLLADTEDIVIRADRIDAGVVVLSDMVAELATLAPTDGSSDADIVNQWLGDWDVHLNDRQTYADQLRAPDATIFLPFLEEVVEERQISDRLDRFAEVNKMESCAHPEDL